MLNIIRGDTKYFKFQRKKKHDGSVITDLPDKLYFTIKYDYNVEDIILQKTLNDGIEYNAEDNYYYITIKPEDTNELPYGKVVYDIEVIKNGVKQTIAIGNIEIAEEVTYASNEV